MRDRVTTFAKRLPAAIVMVATLGSRLLGFARIGLIGAMFGATGSADVLNLVFNIPNNLRKLLAEGALSSAFIPALARADQADHSGKRARGIVQRLIGLQFALLLPLLVLAAWRPAMVTDTILAFPEPARQALAASLFRYLIQYTLLVSLAAVLMGALHARKRFVVSAIAPLLFSVSTIASIILFHRSIGIYSVVVGVIGGGVAQVVVQVPGVLREGFAVWPRFDFSDPTTRDILRRWVPLVGASSVFVINQQVAILLASGLSNGSGSAMTNALVFWQLPFGIFGTSISTVAFAHLSALAARQDYSGFGRELQQTICGLIIFLLPSAVGLFFLGADMIGVALERGAFGPEDTARAASVLRMYAIGLPGVAIYTFQQRAFYALGRYRTPIVVAILTAIIDIGLSLWLRTTALAVSGLAVANSAAFTIGAITLFIALRTQLPGSDVRVARLGGIALKACLASAAALLAVAVVNFVFLNGASGTGFARVLQIPLVRFAIKAIPAGTAVLVTYRWVGIHLREILRR